MCTARSPVGHPRKGSSPDATQDLVRRFLSEWIGLRAIARVTGVSRSWLPGVVNTRYRDGTPHHPGTGGNRRATLPSRIQPSTLPGSAKTAGTPPVWMNTRTDPGRYFLARTSAISPANAFAE